MKKICMVTTSRIDIDSRIQNEAAALSKKFEVKILSRQYDQPETLRNTPYNLKRISYVKLWPYVLNVLSSILALSKAAAQETPDFYHAHDLDGLLATVGAARKHKKPLIYDSHELWSENLANARLKGIGWIIPWLEKRLIRYANAGVTASQGFAEALEEKYGKKFILIRNMPELRTMKSSRVNFKEMFPGEVVIVHAGQVGPSRGIEQLITMLRYLPTNHILVFLGGSSYPIIDQKIDEEEMRERVHFVKEVPPQELVSALKTADIGIVMTEGKSRSKYLSLPNKLLQYLAAEIPVVASDIPEHRRIVASEKIGELTEIAPEEIAQKIKTVLKDLPYYKTSLKDLAQNSYNWQLEGEKLVDFYENFDRSSW